jgi:hypothetical protein
MPFAYSLVCTGLFYNPYNRKAMNVSKIKKLWDDHLEFPQVPNLHLKVGAIIYFMILGL